MLLLAACLSTLSAHGQKPPQKRQVKDSTPVSAPATPSALAVGSYHALIIGINDYQSLPKLKTAVYDATAIANLLQEQYGFKEKKLLLNATRNQILLAINDYKKRLPADSSVLIYYAGHGYRDPLTKRAYWLPVDAQLDNDVNWISASTITDEISGLHSAHVLVISDSCYSGDLRDAGIRPDPRERDIYLKRALESPSRNLMASGSDEPVADLGKNGHSPFAYALIESLRAIQENGFTAGYLFYSYIQQMVPGTSDQMPQYNIIKNSGHEFGDFVFSRNAQPVPVRPGGEGETKGDSGHVGKTPDIPTDVGPSISPEADRYAVNQLVNAYADSYNRKDAAALWKVWPGAPKSTKQAIQDSFNSALSIIMKVTDRDVELASTRATVIGQFAQEYTPKSGSPQKSNGPISLELSKGSGGWVITAVK